MNLESLITDHVENSPPRILLHSVRGLGKSSFAAIAPNPIFIQTETGLAKIKVSHFPVAKTTETFFEYLGMLITEDHNYRTVVIDSADWMEKLFWETVCREEGKDTIVSKGLDFGLGYKKAMKYHNRLIRGLTNLWEKKNMAIIIIAHTAQSIYNNPVGEDYTQFIVKLHYTAASAYEEFVDMVLFLNHKAYVVKQDGMLSKNKATGSGERSFFTQNRPAFSAKSRYDVPFEIPYKKGDGFTDMLKLIKKSK